MLLNHAYQSKGKGDALLFLFLFSGSLRKKGTIELLKIPLCHLFPLELVG